MSLFNLNKDKISLLISILSLIISTALSIFVIIDNHQKEKLKKYDEYTEIMIQTVNNDLLAIESIDQYGIIFEKYKEIQIRKPLDNTGCEKFLDKIEIMLTQGPCDDNVRLLLNYATQLNVIDKNIRLINFTKICNNQ